MRCHWLMGGGGGTNGSSPCPSYCSRVGHHLVGVLGVGELRGPFHVLVGIIHEIIPAGPFTKVKKHSPSLINIAALYVIGIPGVNGIPQAGSHITKVCFISLPNRRYVRATVLNGEPPLKPSDHLPFALSFPLIALANLT